MPHELLTLHHEQRNLKLMNFSKKRVREIRVDVETNPFCGERQVTDIYEQLNFHKNPRFYSVSTEEAVPNRHNYSSLSNQSTDLKANSHSDSREWPDFSTDISHVPTVERFTTPEILSVDSNYLRKLPSISNYKTHRASKTNAIKGSMRQVFLPGNDQYGTRLTSKSVTFGHRPCSAARMFDHFSNTVKGTSSLGCSDRKTSRTKAGMSVMELAQLLALPKKGLSCPATFPGRYDEITEFRRQNAEKMKKTREHKMETRFRNDVYNPPRKLKPNQHFLPDQTIAQRIDKYRKLAVGKMPDTF